VFPATPRANARRRTQDGRVRRPDRRARHEQGRPARREQEQEGQPGGGPGRPDGLACECPVADLAANVTYAPASGGADVFADGARNVTRTAKPGERMRAAHAGRTPPRSHERNMMRRWHYLLGLLIARLPDIVLADPG
jgi:hypothetical protein